jgi:hypothetical protein
MRPLLSSLSFGFPAQQPPSPSSTSLSPWCPRDWKRRLPEFGPRGELPFPSPLSPSPSSSPPARALSFPCTRAPLPSLFAGGAAPPCSPCSAAARTPPSPARPAWPGAAPARPPAPGAAPGGSATGAAPVVAPGAAPAQPRPPARGVPPLGVARVALAWPRAPPFTTNAFPRARTRARGDYSLVCS